MKIFDGREHAKLLDKRIKAYLEQNPAEGALGIVQVGDDFGSEKYIEIKKKYCKSLGISTKVLKIDQNLSDKIIYGMVKEFIDDVNIKGVIIQLPLPRKSLNKILNLIPIEKDVDLLTSQSMTKFYADDFTKLSPVIRAFKYFLQKNSINLENKKCIILGKGVLVGKPIGKYVEHLKARTDILSKYSAGTPLNCHLLVLGAGVSNLVMGEDIIPECNVVDFGYSVIDGRCVGDLCLDSKLNHLGVISSSPGGLGPLVVRFLIMNFLNI